MRLDAVCEPVFARHETFHPRYGWIKKAVDAAISDPGLFNAEAAVVELGVGKNMVRSIKFWGLAFQVLSPMKHSSSKTPLTVPSVIGRTMFADDGWDPYGEYPGTQWMLHWWLLARTSRVPVWWLAFNEFQGVEFTHEQLEQFILDRLRDWDPHPASVQKDVSCLLRMYTGGGAGRSAFDDQIDCPTRDLQLISSTSERGVFRMMIGPKPTLPAGIAAFACLDFIARTDSAARTATVSRLASEPGGPGRVFKLTESALLDLLTEAALTFDEIEVISAAGVPQLTFANGPEIAGTELLYDHYRQLAGSARFTVPLICGPNGSKPILEDTNRAALEHC